MKTRIALFAAAACLTIGLAPALAQPPGGPPSTKLEDQSAMPKDLFVLPPVSHAYKPKKTPWGDPDLRGMWPIDAIGGLSGSGKSTLARALAPELGPAPAR